MTYKGYSIPPGVSTYLQSVVHIALILTPPDTCEYDAEINTR